MLVQNVTGDGLFPYRSDVERFWIEFPLMFVVGIIVDATPPLPAANFFDIPEYIPIPSLFLLSFLARVGHSC